MRGAGDVLHMAQPKGNDDGRDDHHQTEDIKPRICEAVVEGVDGQNDRGQQQKDVA